MTPDREKRGSNYVKLEPTFRRANANSFEMLRARSTLLYWILCSSWTLFQPRALVWDYGYWGTRQKLGSQAGKLTDKIAKFYWKRTVPPFSNLGSPLFTTFRLKKDLAMILTSRWGGSYPCSVVEITIPCRVFTEKKVTVLSGLEGHWTRTSEEDAKHAGRFDQK